ncbi:hypothetical protein J2S73_002400 [Amorphus orientalis]|uniref:Uncharacterized protein n=2 Tax=Amorphus orientalis TaxID=649198 RepID=A0AAE4AT64_9HYPH|nr:hypothetical protein [Amorphus orientalis]
MALPFFGVLVACGLAWMKLRMIAVWVVIATIALTLFLFRYHATSAIDINL